MSNDIDINRFVKDPSLLIELCREVIDRIDSRSDNPKAAEKEAQLKEISKAIEKLEKKEVPVPDAFRAEKTRLAAELGIQTQAEQALYHMADELDAILKDLNARLGSDSDQPTLKKPRVKRSRSPKTDKKILRKNIVKALRTLSGRAKVADVIEQMGHQLEGKLLPGDMEWRESTGEHAWQNNAKWERYRMTKDGTLRSDSPRGYWELGEEQQ
jgi:exonuclease VII small subunit